VVVSVRARRPDSVSMNQIICSMSSMGRPSLRYDTRAQDAVGRAWSLVFNVVEPQPHFSSKSQGVVITRWTTLSSCFRFILNVLLCTI